MPLFTTAGCKSRCLTTFLLLLTSLIFPLGMARADDPDISFYLSSSVGYIGYDDNTFFDVPDAPLSVAQETVMAFKTVPTVVDTSVADGVMYYHVAASNAIGVSDPSNPVSQTISFQPDLSIRLLPRTDELLTDAQAAAKGGNVFNQTLATIRSEQQFPLLVTGGVSRSVAVKVKNAGTLSTAYKITLPTPPAGYQAVLLSALEGGTDVTAEATSEGGWLTSQIAPGASLELKLTITADAGVDADYVAALRAEVGAFHDGVAAVASLQNIAKLQWCAQDGQWADVTADTVLPARQGMPIGVRAVKRRADLPWIDATGNEFGAVPLWQYEGKTLKGQELWIEFKNPTKAGDALQNVTAQCGNQKSIQARVRPAYQLFLLINKDMVLAGTGPASLTQVQLKAKVEDMNGNSVSGVMVRFSAATADGNPAGSFGAAGVAQIVSEAGTDGTARTIWASGVQEDTVMFRAEVLDWDNVLLSASNVMDVSVSAPYTRIELGQWQEDVQGAWSRSVQVSVWYHNQKLANRAVQLSQQVLLDEVPVAGNVAPLDAATGATDANGIFMTTQRWNPPQAGDWPHDYDITVDATAGN